MIYYFCVFYMIILFLTGCVECPMGPQGEKGDTDTVYISNLDTVFIISKDTILIPGNNKIHIFNGVFTTTVNNVERDGDRWIITLPIEIKENWICLSYYCSYPDWSRHIALEDYLTSTFVIYAFDGTIDIYDPDLKLQDGYWKIIFIETL